MLKKQKRWLVINNKQFRWITRYVASPAISARKIPNKKKSKYKTSGKHKYTRKRNSPSTTIVANSPFSNCHRIIPNLSRTTKMRLLLRCQLFPLEASDLLTKTISARPSSAWEKNCQTDPFSKLLCGYIRLLTSSNLSTGEGKATKMREISTGRASTQGQMILTISSLCSTMGV